MQSRGEGSSMRMCWFRREFWCAVIVFMAVGCALDEGTGEEIATNRDSLQSVNVSVSGLANLYQHTHPDRVTQGSIPPVLVPEACVQPGQDVHVTASGCTVAAGASCIGPDGAAASFHDLRVYGLIGRWSTSATALDSTTAVGAPFFVGASATLVAPTDGPGPYHLFLGENDGNFADNGGAYDVTVEWAGQSVCGADPVDDDTDNDNDGIAAELDCDDDDSTLGAVLYEDTFGSDTGWFRTTSQLDDPWNFGHGTVSSSDGGQQALLGQEQDWTDVAVFATLSATGTQRGCCGEQGSTNRWRAGIMLRASLDSDQDEGFRAYRCALASNAEGTGGIPHAGPSTGRFLQLAEFMDATEDDTQSECEDGPNTTFNELDRHDHDIVDLAAGGVAQLAFYAVGDELRCELGAGQETVTVTGQDDSFGHGTVGLSTLNMFGAFQEIKVCQVLTEPAPVCTLDDDCELAYIDAYADPEEWEGGYDCVWGSLRDRKPGIYRQEKDWGDAVKHSRIIARSDGTALHWTKFDSDGDGPPPVPTIERCDLKPSAYFEDCSDNVTARCVRPSDWLENCVEVTDFSCDGFE